MHSILPLFFFFSSRRRHTRYWRDWSSERVLFRSRAGSAELLISTDEERGAAAFIEGFLVMGSEEDVRRCLRALLDTHDPSGASPLRRATASSGGRAAFVRTLTDERDSARAVLSHFAPRVDAARLEEALWWRRYAVSETNLAGGGFEKRTRFA